MLYWIGGVRMLDDYVASCELSLVLLVDRVVGSSGSSGGGGSGGSGRRKF